MCGICSFLIISSFLLQSERVYPKVLLVKNHKILVLCYALLIAHCLKHTHDI
jgi:hypothetical protein